MFLFYIPAPAPPQEKEKTYWYNSGTKKYYLKEEGKYYEVDEKGIKGKEVARTGIIGVVSDEKSLPWNKKKQEKKEPEQKKTDEKKKEGFSESKKKDEKKKETLPVIRRTDTKKQDEALALICGNYRSKTFVGDDYIVTISEAGELSMKRGKDDIPAGKMKAAYYKTIAVQVILNAVNEAGLDVDGAWGNATQRAFENFNGKPEEEAEVEKKKPVFLAQKQYEGTPRMRYDDIMDKKSAEDKTIAYLIESNLLTKEQIDNPTANEQKLFTAVYIMMLGRRYGATKDAFDLLPGILRENGMETTTDNMLKCIWDESTQKSLLAEAMVGQRVGDKRVSKGNSEWWAGNFKVIVGEITPSAKKEAQSKDISLLLADAKELLSNNSELQLSSNQYSALNALYKKMSADGYIPGGNDSQLLSAAIDEFRAVVYKELGGKIRTAETLVLGAEKNLIFPNAAANILQKAVDKANTIGEKNVFPKDVWELNSKIGRYLLSTTKSQEQTSQEQVEMQTGDAAVLEIIGKIRSKQMGIFEGLQQLGFIYAIEKEPGAKRLEEGQRVITSDGVERQIVRPPTGKACYEVKLDGKTYYVGFTDENFSMFYNGKKPYTGLYEQTGRGKSKSFFDAVSRNDLKNAEIADVLLTLEKRAQRRQKPVSNQEVAMEKTEVVEQTAPEKKEQTIPVEEQVKKQLGLAQGLLSSIPVGFEGESEARSLRNLTNSINSGEMEADEYALGMLKKYISQYQSALASFESNKTEVTQKQQETKTERQEQKQQETKTERQEQKQQETKTETQVKTRQETKTERQEQTRQETKTEPKVGVENLNGDDLLNKESSAYQYNDELSGIKSVEGIHKLLKENFSEIKNGLINETGKGEAEVLGAIGRFVKDLSTDQLMQSMLEEVRMPDDFIQMVKEYAK